MKHMRTVKTIYRLDDVDIRKILGLREISASGKFVTKSVAEKYDSSSFDTMCFSEVPSVLSVNPVTFPHNFSQQISRKVSDFIA